MAYGESIGVSGRPDLDYDSIVSGIIITLEEDFHELNHEFLTILKDPCTEKVWDSIRINTINIFENKGSEVLDNLIKGLSFKKATEEELVKFRKFIKDKIVNRYLVYREGIVEYINTLSLDEMARTQITEILREFELSLTSFIDNISFESFGDFVESSEKRIKEVCSLQLLKVLSN